MPRVTATLTATRTNQQAPLLEQHLQLVDSRILVMSTQDLLDWLRVYDRDFRLILIAYAIGRCLSPDQPQDPDKTDRWNDALHHYVGVPR